MGLATQTHCRRGHQLSGTNVRRANGRRYCRACQAMGQRESQRRKREGEMALWLPIEPFTEWIHANRPPEMTWEEFERRLGVSRGGLNHCIHHGRRKQIHLDFADRVLCAAGAHLRDVYPDLYDPEESA